MTVDLSVINYLVVKSATNLLFFLTVLHGVPLSFTASRKGLIKHGAFLKLDEFSGAKVSPVVWDPPSIDDFFTQRKFCRKKGHIKQRLAILIYSN